METWTMELLHDNCAECKAEADAAITLAKVTGSRGATQETGDGSGKVAHAATVTRVKKRTIEELNALCEKSRTARLQGLPEPLLYDEWRDVVDALLDGKIR